mmetsp:Transcript_23209/g.41070  ORF Transcript_23209/g.41070 Transcript_23209/m.41070 type:complete len:276 (-) Transcript_23209:176-1003(-)
MGRCMQSLCRSFLVALNSIVLLVAMCITGVAIFVVVMEYRAGLVTGQESWPVFMPLAFGAVLMMMSLIGCCVALEDKHCMIGLFGFIQFIFSIVVIAAGVVLIQYTTYLQEISVTPVNELEPGYLDSRLILNDFSLGIYETCCGVDMIPPSSECPANSDSLNAYCYFDKDVYNSTFKTPTSTCNALKDQFDVCDSASGDGAGLKTFQADLAEIAENYALNAGYAFCFFGAILLLAAMGSSYLACCASKDVGYEKARQAPNQGTGGPVHDHGVSMT